MTRFAALFACLLLLAACTPSPVAQAQAPVTPMPVDAGAQQAAANAAATQGAAYAQMTQAAQQLAAAAAATQQANADRQFYLAGTAQAQVAQQDAQRLAMEAQAQRATLAARETVDGLSAMATRQAITVAATAAAMQATGQAAEVFAAGTQAAAVAGVAAATAEYNRLAASQEALLFADRTFAESQIIRAAPTATARAQAAHLERQATVTRGVTITLMIGASILMVVFGILLLAFGSRWADARVQIKEHQAEKARLEALRAAYMHLGNGQVLIVGKSPMVVDVASLAHLPADVRAEEPAQSPGNPSTEPDKLEAFLIRAARFAGDRWKSRTLPSHTQMRVSSETWMRFTDWLQEHGAIEKRDRQGTFVTEDFDDLQGIYRAISDGDIPSPPPLASGSRPPYQNSQERARTGRTAA